jgi:hypothetical protein
LPATPNKPKNDEREWVISNRELAKSVYTAKHLFALNQCRHEKNTSLDLQSTKAGYAERYALALVQYDHLTTGMKDRWEMEARSHDEQQPMIQSRITDMLKDNPKISWESLELAIDRWCCASTIRRWAISHPTFKTYCERVVPLLSDRQKQSHLTFAGHFRNNWGLGAGKYLLIMYDEKWFWGLVTRRGAKACKELGIEEKSFKAYHKNHINKVMAIAFTAFAFVDCIDNGGCAEKLAFIRAQGKKVAARRQRKAVKDKDTGRITYSGDTVREKGEVYNVDCAVTGSNTGTPDDPKCPLLPIFQDAIFPIVEKLVGLNGKYEGYTPVFQGDNAGPHIDATYQTAIKGHCETKGWHWKPQAAQMPHMNVLDLSVFPCMSKRHTQKSRECGGSRVLPVDEIWENAEDVWKELPNSKVASAYVQAYRIADKVIQAKGDNEFLGSGGNIHCGIRNDFKFTANGLERKDKKTISAPNN